MRFAAARSARARLDSPRRQKRSSREKEHDKNRANASVLLELICDVLAGGSERLELRLTSPSSSDATALWTRTSSSSSFTIADVDTALGNSSVVACAWLRRGLPGRRELVGLARIVGDMHFVGVLCTAVDERRVEQPVLLRSTLVSMCCNEAQALSPLAAGRDQQMSLVYPLGSSESRMRLRLRELGFRGGPRGQMMMRWSCDAMPPLPSRLQRNSIPDLNF
jgi:hypothetical protein